MLVFQLLVMIIRTKKYQLPINTYIQLGLKNIIREQWWVLLVALFIMSGSFFVHTIWFVLGANIALVLYFLFWIIQFYGITYLEQNQLLFERLRYEISSQQITVQVTSRHGMPIAWNQVRRVIRGKESFLLVVSKAHLIYLPHAIFNSKYEIKFLETVLKRKGLL